MTAENTQNDDFGFDPDGSFSDSGSSHADVDTKDRSSGDGDGDQQKSPRKRRRRRRNSSGNGNPSNNVNPGGRPRQDSGRNQGGRNRQRNKGPRRGAKFTPAPNLEGAQTSGTIEGILELHPKGYGFIRSIENDYGAQEIDPFVSSSLVEKYKLREGILIRGEVGPGNRGQGPRLQEVETIDGRTPEEYEQIKNFDDLTPINPFEQIKLETGAMPITMRVMDLLTPIGKGQRALLVAPPRSGKTMLLQDIANAISKNHPEVHLIVLLIDERPEEVTEMRRMVNGEVIASSMDREVESHIRISQLIIERGKRLAESGKDCVILLDSITRTARAFNKWVGNSGRTGTGGLDVRALDIPRKMFGTARRFDEGGSLTVIATALIETGSRMDDAIFQEFKGTGNMELVLSRELADRRIWPAIDISRSGTRREEKILGEETLNSVIQLRRALVSMNPTEAMTELVRKLEMFSTNAEFLERVRSVL
ncbi:MAG: transcription termination factor Rho [Planctomycetaceae bacterium]